MTTSTFHFFSNITNIFFLILLIITILWQSILLSRLFNERLKNISIHPAWFYLALSLLSSLGIQFSWLVTISKFFISFNFDNGTRFLIHAAYGLWLISTVSFLLFCSYLVKRRPRLSWLQAVTVSTTTLFSFLLFIRAFLKCSNPITFQDRIIVLPLLLGITFLIIPNTVYYFSRIDFAGLSNKFKKQVRWLFCLFLIPPIILEWLVIILEFGGPGFLDVFLLILATKTMNIAGVLFSLIGFMYSTKLVLELSSDRKQKTIKKD